MQVFLFKQRYWIAQKAKRKVCGINREGDNNQPATKCCVPRNGSPCKDESSNSSLKKKTISLPQGMNSTPTLARNFQCIYQCKQVHYNGRLRLLLYSHQKTVRLLAPSVGFVLLFFFKYIIFNASHALSVGISRFYHSSRVAKP